MTPAERRALEWARGEVIAFECRYKGQKIGKVCQTYQGRSFCQKFLSDNIPEEAFVESVAMRTVMDLDYGIEPWEDIYYHAITNPIVEPHPEVDTYFSHHI